MSHGLVIGKFYPPHAGHHHLVRTAAERCDRLSVVVMASSVESLALADRVAWMREVHADDPRIAVVGVVDDHPVDYGSDAIWRAHVDLMIAAVDGAPVDVVFTSERYGDELGRRLGARHELIDLDRRTCPISATAVRADPVGHWWQLAPCVRGHLALRAVLVGAESTGKTTLAAELAAALQRRSGAHGATRWVAEVGRDVTVEKLAARGPGATIEDLTWATPDFVAVARRQAAREDEAARAGGPVVVCDTDAFATGVWHQRYVGARSDEVERLAVAAPAHLYLLTDPDDVPFVDDGMRDGAHLRRWMTDRFVERLEATGRRWRWLRGERDRRRAAALTAIDDALADALRFAPPLGQRGDGRPGPPAVTR